MIKENNLNFILNCIYLANIVNRISQGLATQEICNQQLPAPSRKMFYLTDLFPLGLA